MALKEPRVGGGQESDSDQLPGVEVLGHPHKRAVVAVVHCMDVFVQKAHLVVGPMPYIVLEVEDHQTGYLVPYEFQQGGGKVWQGGGRGPDPLTHSGGEHEQDMVPEGQL